METRADTKLRIVQHATALAFPSDIIVSHRAINLIECLLCEKGQRLCSAKYSLNDDSRLRRQMRAQQDPKATRNTPGPPALFVYADDAADLKQHAFFRGTQWDRIHTMKPPFVPKVKSWEDTRYFEEDEPVSDVDDASSEDSTTHHVVPSAAVVATAPSACDNNPDEALSLIALSPTDTTSAAAIHLKEIPDAHSQKDTNPIKDKRRERKRPRDKILRDKQVGREVLEIRKRGAFAGYDYRRPREYIPRPMGAASSDRDASMDTEALRNSTTERDRAEKIGLGSGISGWKMGIGGGSHLGM